ncbi:MAG TPA: nuclear transport factor 2 family protein [Acidothermaceae bacterium]|jgi:3-phenylpropionate/cinnamic acid dioxygenase small subunit
MPDLSTVIDHFDIERLIFSVGRCLDERDFDGLRELFTDNASVSTPGGEVRGHDALVAQARARHSNDEGIQHLITNLLIDHDGDLAAVRANLLVTFAKTGVGDPAPFVLGEVYRFNLERTSSGWRITRLTSSPVWTLNLPPQLAAAL